MEGLLKTFANLKNTESLETEHYDQVSYILNCFSWILSFLFAKKLPEN